MGVEQKVDKLLQTALHRLDDAATLAVVATKPCLNRSDVEVEITRSRKERIDFLTEVFRSLKESEDSIQIQAALGGDDGDLDEFAIALENSGILRSLEKTTPLYLIKITQTPSGEAPDEVRRAWVDTCHLAIQMPAESRSSVGVVSGEPMLKRDEYAVLTSEALEALHFCRRDEAISWFRENNMAQFPVLTFGLDEVAVLREM